MRLNIPLRPALGLLVILSFSGCVGGSAPADIDDEPSGSRAERSSPMTMTEAPPPTSDTTEPEQCPPGPGDDGCAQCIKASCCDPLSACMANLDCFCYWDCLNGDSPQLCQCAVAPTDVPELGDLFQCAGDNCSQCG